MKTSTLNKTKNTTHATEHSKKHDIKTLSTKTFQRDGKWVERPRVSEVLVCACGTKYIKTRRNQTTCIKCMYL